ncbi:hypothetical protein PO909_002701, partial [Leuciscus waleckii]
ERSSYPSCALSGSYQLNILHTHSLLYFPAASVWFTHSLPKIIPITNNQNGTSAVNDRVLHFEAKLSVCHGEVWRDAALLRSPATFSLLLDVPFSVSNTFENICWEFRPVCAAGPQAFATE